MFAVLTGDGHVLPFTMDLRKNSKAREKKKKKVVTFLHDIMGSPIALDPKQCLLGIFSDTVDKFTKTFLHEALFSVRKIIARKSMRPSPLVLQSGGRKSTYPCPIKDTYISTEAAQPNTIRSGTAGYRSQRLAVKYEPDQ